MPAVVNGESHGCNDTELTKKDVRIFSRETSADDTDLTEKGAQSQHPISDSFSLSSVSDASDKEDQSRKETSDVESDAELVDKGDAQLAAIASHPRRFAWTRARPTGDQQAASADEPAACQAVTLEAADDSAAYSRSFMLQVRLKLLEADEAQGPLGISAKSRAHAAALEEAPTEAAVGGSTSQLTTMMLRNLPNQCTRGMLVSWLCGTDFSGEFDLVYVPVDRTSGNNLGYAFINFIKASACQRFIRSMHGMKAAKCFPGSRSAKVLQCCYAKVQGKEPYCQGLANANKLTDWDMAMLAYAGDFAESAGCGMRAAAPDFVPTLGAWCADAAEATCADDEAEEPASSSSGPKGLRADAPDFVPGCLQSAISRTDQFLEAFTGMSIADLQAQHTQAAARAKRCAAERAQGYIPGLGCLAAAREGGANHIFVPAAEAPAAPARGGEATEAW